LLFQNEASLAARRGASPPPSPGAPASVFGDADVDMPVDGLESPNPNPRPPRFDAAVKLELRPPALLRDEDIARFMLPTHHFAPAADVYALCAETDRVGRTRRGSGSTGLLGSLGL
jgi:hypothetical protein